MKILQELNFQFLVEQDLRHDEAVTEKIEILMTLAAKEVEMRTELDEDRMTRPYSLRFSPWTLRSDQHPWIPCVWRAAGTAGVAR